MEFLETWEWWHWVLLGAGSILLAWLITWLPWVSSDDPPKPVAEPPKDDEPRWVRAWKCIECGDITWGTYQNGELHDRDFCKACGSEIVLGVAEAKGMNLWRSSIFKPKAKAISAQGEAFICQYCGAPNVPSHK